MKLCECGCGQPTTIAIASHAKSGAVKGQPHRFVWGHHTRSPEVRARMRATSRATHGTDERFRAIEQRARSGEKLAAIGADYGISRQRVDQILNHGKATARRTLHAAVTTGAIIRACHCEECGTIGETEAHHDDYSRPLEVRWLCLVCHQVADKIAAVSRRATKMFDGDELLSSAEAARVLGVHYITFRKLVRRGEVRAIKISRVRECFRRSDVLRLKDSRQLRQPRAVCSVGHKMTPDNIGFSGTCRACNASNQLAFHGKTRRTMSVYAARQAFRECGFEIRRTTGHAVYGVHAETGLEAHVSRGFGMLWRIRSNDARDGWAVDNVGVLARALKDISRSSGEKAA